MIRFFMRNQHRRFCLCRSTQAVVCPAARLAHQFGLFASPTCTFGRVGVQLSTIRCPRSVSHQTTAPTPAALKTHSCTHLS